jgi:hypothetical protein
MLNFFDIYTAVPEVLESNSISCIVYPNPVKSNAEFRYYLPKDCHVNLEVYNSTGQQVMKLADGNQTKGAHHVQWNAEGLPAGIYYYLLRSGKRAETGKIIILK